LHNPCHYQLIDRSVSVRTWARASREIASERSIESNGRECVCLFVCVCVCVCVFVCVFVFFFVRVREKECVCV